MDKVLQRVNNYFCVWLIRSVTWAIHVCVCMWTRERGKESITLERSFKESVIWKCQVLERHRHVRDEIFRWTGKQIKDNIFCNIEEFSPHAQGLRFSPRIPTLNVVMTGLNAVLIWVETKSKLVSFTYDLAINGCHGHHLEKE